MESAAGSRAELAAVEVGLAVAAVEVGLAVAAGDAKAGELERALDKFSAPFSVEVVELLASDVFPATTAPCEGALPCSVGGPAEIHKLL